MLNTRKILYWAVTAVCCGLLPFGCVKEDTASLGERHDVAVRLNVGTRTVSETDGTPASAESDIHTLRVYAFVDGQPAGHYFTKDVESLPHTFFMDLTFYSATTQQVDFYIVANETAMQAQGSGAPAALSENTTESQLNAYWFTDLSRDMASHGLPMFCKKSEELNFTNVKTESPSDPEHAGHTLLDYNIKFELQRPVGKLGVFAAKPYGEAGELRITGLTMLESGTRTRNYLMPQSDETLKDVTGITGDISLAVISGNVDKTLSPDISDVERKNPANYTPVLDAPFYPFENPWGSIDWNVKGDEKGNVLQIKYEYDGVSRTGLVYLPPIKRNCYYTVCCLMHNDGKITVEYTVADWEDESYELDFDYPSYDNPITPFGSTELPEGGKYPQPTVWYNSDLDSPEGSYSFSFKMTGPTGQAWTPTLLDNPGKFEVAVFQNGQKIETDRMVASPDAYQIRVKALDGANVNETVSLGISYVPTWSNERSLLLINGLTDDLKWEGSRFAEMIVIKQIEVPKN